jgi:hypothetical protein
MVAGAGCACGQKVTPAAKPTVPVKWLLEYQGEGDADVRNDPQFALLLQRTLPQRQYFESGMSLAKAIQYYLGVGTGRVTVDDGRYAMVTGCVPHMCDTSEGLLWVDTQSAPANVLFAALDPIAGTQVAGSTTTYHLWIFGSQLLHADFDHVDALPDDFVKALQENVGDRPVASVTFVEPSGIMIPLLPKQSLHLSQATEIDQSGSLKGSQ